MTTHAMRLPSPLTGLHTLCGLTLTDAPEGDLITCNHLLVDCPGCIDIHPCPKCGRVDGHRPSCQDRTETAAEVAKRLVLVGPTECTHGRPMAWDCKRCGRAGGVR